MAKIILKSVAIPPAYFAFGTKFGIGNRSHAGCTNGLKRMRGIEVPELPLYPRQDNPQVSLIWLIQFFGTVKEAISRILVAPAISKNWFIEARVKKANEN